MTPIPPVRNPALLSSASRSAYSKNLHMYHVGQRLRLATDRGTVRFIGPLREGADDIWYGIEWDTARGKHDGEAGGVRYFVWCVFF